MEKVYLDLVKLMVFVIPIIFGLVEFIKAALELEGKVVTLVSFLVGVLFAVATSATYLYPKSALYIAVGIFVVASGLVASGYYKFFAKNHLSG